MYAKRERERRKKEKKKWSNYQFLSPTFPSTNTSKKTAESFISRPFSFFFFFFFAPLPFFMLVILCIFLVFGAHFFPAQHLPAAFHEEIQAKKYLMATIISKRKKKRLYTSSSISVFINISVTYVGNRYANTSIE